MGWIKTIVLRCNKLRIFQSRTQPFWLCSSIL